MEKLFYTGFKRLFGENIQMVKKKIKNALVDNSQCIQHNTAVLLQ